MSQEPQKRTYRAPVNATILWGHKMIHEGVSYYVKDYHKFETSGTQVFDLLALVRGIPQIFDEEVPHVTWDFDCNLECTFQLFENVLITGTPADPIENENHNRLIARLPEPYRYSFWRTGFEITDTGHRMYNSIFEGGVSHEGHLLTNRAEFIGNPNFNPSGVYYLFRFTKESQNKGWLDYYITYYLQ